MEDVLKRLDSLTQEEARMATAEVLKIANGINDKTNVLIDGMQTSLVLDRFLKFKPLSS